MSKQKDFKNLFGCDDSDEENMQLQLSNASVIENKKNISGSDDKSKHKQSKTISENSKHTTKKVEQLEGKRLKSFVNEQNKKIKTEYMGEEKKKRIHEINPISNPIAYDSDMSKTIRSSHIKFGQDGDGKEKVKLKKTEIGGLVVKLLTPAYVEKRFESRETFKMLARNISHALHDKGNILLFKFLTI